MEDSTQNPYLQEDLAAAPFAGRQQAFSQLHQHLIDPAKTHALPFLGRRGIGKSAFLRRVDAVFDESFVSVYLPITTMPLSSEDAWLEALVAATSAALEERGFSLSRLEARTGEEDSLRAWLARTRLPVLLATIRPQRRLVWLLDAAERLMDALQAGSLPMDLPAYLQTLLHDYPQLGIVLAVDAAREDDLELLSPLVNMVEVIRLGNLSPEETAQLLQEPAAGLYTVPAESAALIYQASGGQPRLLQEFGFRLFHHWQRHPGTDTIPPDAIRPLIQGIYAAREDDFKQTWEALSRDERLILTAMSSLLYAHPTQKITATALESWLVETDYPMDKTAINAAIRSLEYQELLRQAGGGVTLTSGLMQRWLIENAQLAAQGSAGQALRPPNRSLLLTVAALVGIGLLVILLVLSAPRSEVAPESMPTVTLSQSE